LRPSASPEFYKDFAAIRDVTFSVPQGQVAAFLGPNGAGKCTTMKILTGYLAPSAGEARIAGVVVRLRITEDCAAGSLRVARHPTQALSHNPT